MVMKVLRQEWWRDTSALPGLLWARLDFYGDHHVQIFDRDGQYHHFNSEKQAKGWLRGNEYSELQGLIHSGDVPLDLEPPSAASDELLVRRMSCMMPDAVVSPPLPRRRRLNIPLLLSAVFIAVMIVA